MPRLVDRLRKYITDGKNNGTLSPGDRLPGYHQFMELLGGSYATVLAAMNKLREEGLVDLRNGEGSFVAGARRFKLRFYTLKSTLDFPVYQALLEKHIQRLGLHIDVELSNTPERETHEMAAPSENEPAILIETAPDYAYNLPGNYAFNDYGDFAEIKGGLVPEYNSRYAALLPYYAISMQRGISRKLLRKAEFEEVEGADFSWWSAYAAACRKHDVTPGTCRGGGSSYKWPFMELGSLFCALKLEESGVLQLAAPCFATEAGRKFLEISKDIVFSDDSGSADFFQGTAAMNFRVGSWISVQNHRRSDISVEDLEILPYRYGRKKLCMMNIRYLQAHLCEGAGADLRNRVWKVVKMLLSLEFQKEFCALAGVLSVRKDFPENGYKWNQSKLFSAFVPKRGDLIVPDNLFGYEMRGYGMAMLEAYRAGYAPADELLEKMDEKLK